MSLTGIVTGALCLCQLPSLHYKYALKEGALRSMFSSLQCVQSSSLIALEIISQQLLASVFDPTVLKWASWEEALYGPAWVLRKVISSLHITSPHSSFIHP